MRKLLRAVAAMACVSLSLSFPALAEGLRVQSPGQRTQIEFELADGGAARYRVLYRGRPVIASSPLGARPRRGRHVVAGAAPARPRRARP
ncbi:hypothetical protein HH297_16785 [Xanthomonas sp. Kuri4-3]